MSEVTFGQYLLEKRALIKGTELAKAAGISAPYLADIEKGARKAPAAEIQIKMASFLKMNDDEKYRFYDLAAKERNDVPADVYLYLKNNVDLIQSIRFDIIKKGRGEL